MHIVLRLRAGAGPFIIKTVNGASYRADIDGTVSDAKLMMSEELSVPVSKITLLANNRQLRDGTITNLPLKPLY